MTKQRNEEPSLIWTKHLKKPSKEYNEFNDLIRNSTQILTRLLEILQEQEESLARKEVTEAQYTDTNWSHLQAHRNGRMEQIQTIKALLSHLK